MNNKDIKEFRYRSQIARYILNKDMQRAENEIHRKEYIEQQRIMR